MMDTISQREFTNMQKSVQSGMSLIEVMIALVLGLIIVGGVWTLLVNSRSSLSTSQNQAYMLDTGRFALHTIGQDLLMAGGFGRTNWTHLITGDNAMPAAIGDCRAGFYVDALRKVFGIDDSNTAYNSPCVAAADRKAGTDILVVRYANPVPVSDADVVSGANVNTPFVKTYLGQSRMFIGGDPAQLPNIPNARNFNHRLITNVYYINQDTVAGDGIPSLRKVSVERGDTGPEMLDQVLASGVEEFQVQYGINDCAASACPRTINRYVDADNAFFGGTEWPELEAVRRVDSVRIWLLVRSESREIDFDTSDSFVMAGRTLSTPNDGYRRSLYYSVFSMRKARDKSRGI